MVPGARRARGILASVAATDVRGPSLPSLPSPDTARITRRAWPCGGARLAHLDLARGPDGRAVPSEQVRDRTRSILEQHLSAVTSPSVATLVVQRARAAADGMSEADRAKAVMGEPASAVARITAAARGRSATDGLAAVLIQTASHALAAGQEAAAVADAVYDVLGSGTHRVSPAAKRARCLLRDAAVRGLRMPEALEARVFLALSSLPHPALGRALCEAVGGVATGGGVWLAGTAGAYLLRVEGSDRALKLVTPILPAVALIAERPAKAFFASRRPFRHLVGMMLLGGKPRRRSFPSGHAATSFAGAWVLGCVWPQRRPVFLGLATLVSLSRVYLGAHDPGEILAGSLLGIALAEVLRRPTERLLARIEVPEAARAAGLLVRRQEPDR